MSGWRGQSCGAEGDTELLGIHLRLHFLTWYHKAPEDVRCAINGKCTMDFKDVAPTIPNVELTDFVYTNYMCK